MSTIAEIESAIEKLPPQEQRQLRDWILAREASADADPGETPAAGRRSTEPSCRSRRKS
jgi:hypothetical protein